MILSYQLIYLCHPPVEEYLVDPYNHQEKVVVDRSIDL